jgi:hypothetical protein
MRPDIGAQIDRIEAVDPMLDLPSGLDDRPATPA